MFMVLGQHGDKQADMVMDHITMVGARSHSDLQQEAERDCMQLGWNGLSLKT